MGGLQITVKSGAEDLISELPRNLIDCILERMPVQDAARTSILARKWRNVWATHPQLVFDKQFFEQTLENQRSFQYGFVRIINKILLLHSGPILKFILYIPNLGFVQNPEDIDHWLLVLSRNGIKELTVDNANHNPYKLPSYIFSCPELTHLKLCNCIFKPPHAFSCFRYLISLYFHKIAFATNMLGALFSSASLLERLTFVTCTGIDHFNIRAPKLKALHVHNIHQFKSISFEDTPNLILVSIAPCYKVDNPRQGKTISLIELLIGLPRIVKLILDGFFLQVLITGGVPMRLPTTTEHLKRLNFYGIDFDDLGQILCILCLLRSSTNLQELEIGVFSATERVKDPVFDFLEESDCMDLTLDQLQTVKFKSYKGLRAELRFIKLLLACCPSLERMLVDLNAVVDAKEGLRISKELMRFSRASTKAEIIYVDSHVC